MRKEYFKVMRNQKVYYIGMALKDKVEEELAALKPEYGEKWFELKLMQFSDFAVDTSTNEFMKCRFMLEHVIDEFTGTGVF
jgi:hypothetical protein